MIIVATVAVWAVTSSTGHPDGDPGGRILHALQQVKTVLPADATAVNTTATDSTYSTKCPDNPYGKSGWSAVTVGSTFRSSLPGSELVPALGGKLARLGWHRTTPVDSNFTQYPPQAAWQKTLFPGQTATADILQIPPGNGPGTGTWTFIAFAKPPGFALPGC